MAAAGGLTASAVIGFGACAAEIIQTPTLMSSLGMIYLALLAGAMIFWSALMSLARPHDSTASFIGAVFRFGGLAVLWVLCLALIQTMP